MTDLTLYLLSERKELIIVLNVVKQQTSWKFYTVETIVRKWATYNFLGTCMYNILAKCVAEVARLAHKSRKGTRKNVSVIKLQTFMRKSPRVWLLG